MKNGKEPPPRKRRRSPRQPRQPFKGGANAKVVIQSLRLPCPFCGRVEPTVKHTDTYGDKGSRLASQAAAMTPTRRLARKPRSRL